MRPSALSRALLAAAALLVAAALPADAQVRALAPADPADVATPQAVVDALYASIARAPGEDYDWDRNLSLFLPSARVIANTEQRGGAFVVHTPEQFRALVDSFTVVGGEGDLGFQEEELHNVVERFGDVAHVFSTYQKRWWGDDEILGRGINSIQMVWHEGRWWISSIAWDEEVGAGPLPGRYLPG